MPPETHLIEICENPMHSFHADFRFISPSNWKCHWLPALASPFDAFIRMCSHGGGSPRMYHAKMPSCLAAFASSLSAVTSTVLELAASAEKKPSLMLRI